jgi:hypothetical protein
MATHPSQRDYRIDFWRGLALCTIFINHIPGNFFEIFTHRNIGFSDSAELFVFISGFTAALAYYLKFMGGQPWQQSYKAVRRAGQLYMAHIVSLVGAIAVFAAAAIYFSDAAWLARINIQPFMNDPVRGIVGVATLGHHLAYFNILTMYIVFLLALPFIMALARYDLMLALGASFALYLATHIMGWNFPTYPTNQGWFFNPLAWQLVFTLGFVCGSLYVSGQKVPFNIWWFSAAVAYLLLAFITVQFNLWPQKSVMGLPVFLGGFDKGGQSLPRLLHLLALAYVIVNLPVNTWLRQLSENNLVVIIGRHALPIFCVGSILSMVAVIIRDHLGGSIMLDIQLVGGGLLVQALLALVMEWNRRASLPSPPAKKVAVDNKTLSVKQKPARITVS